MTAREELARRQAELLAALLTGSAPPDGFEPWAIAREADALRAKRVRVIGYLRPDLRDALGTTFDDRCSEYVAGHPRRADVRARTDAAMFAQWLVDRGDLPRPRRRPWRRALRRRTTAGW